MHRSSVSAPDLHDAPVQALGGQPRLIARLALIGSLYLAQAIPMGFVFGAMPVVLRQQGASLRQIGLLFLLHLPWVLKLFYAARLESLRPGPLGRRKSWIAPMQWLAGRGLTPRPDSPESSFCSWPTTWPWPRATSPWTATPRTS